MFRANCKRKRHQRPLSSYTTDNMLQSTTQKGVILEDYE